MGDDFPKSIQIQGRVILFLDGRIYYHVMTSGKTKMYKSSTKMFK